MRITHVFMVVFFGCFAVSVSGAVSNCDTVVMSQTGLDLLARSLVLEDSNCFDRVAALWKADPAVAFTITEQMIRCAKTNSINRYVLSNVVLAAINAAVPASAIERTTFVEQRQKAVCACFTLNEVRGDRALWVALAGLLGSTRAAIASNLTAHIHRSYVGPDQHKYDQIEHENFDAMLRSRYVKSLKESNWEISIYLLDQGIEKSAANLSPAEKEGFVRKIADAALLTITERSNLATRVGAESK